MQAVVWRMLEESVSLTAMQLPALEIILISSCLVDLLKDY